MLAGAAVVFVHQSVHTLAQLAMRFLAVLNPVLDRDNSVKISDGSDGQAGAMRQTEEGHPRSCAAMGVAEE